MNKQNENQPTYKKAVEEIERLVKEIESGNLDLDDLLKKVERATKLITYCKNKLKESEATLEEIIKRIENDKE